MKYAFAVISIILFGLYISTAPPVMYLGDDGEVISAAYTLGIGHPPGYPLYMLYTKLFSYLPFGSIAYRANLAAGFLAVLIFLLFYLCGKQALAVIFEDENNNTRLSSLLAALIYSVSSVFWFEAIHSKGAIYLIMHLIVLLTLLSGMYYYRTKKLKYFYAAFFAAGFLIPAHNTSALFMLFSIAALYYAARGGLKQANRINLPLFLNAPVFFLLALVTPYIYLFIRMKAAPVINWGNLETYREVFGHIIRETYNYNTANKSNLVAIASRFGDYFSVYASNYWLLGIAAVAGVYYVLKKSAALFAAAVVFYVFNLAILLYVINTSGGFMINDLSSLTLYASKNFYLSSDILPVLAGAAGLYGIIRFFSNKIGIATPFLFALAGLMPVIMIFSNYDANNKSSEFLAYDHADNILKSVPECAILFTGEDCPSFNIVYMQAIQGKYRDIRTYDSGGCLLDYSLYKRMKHKWDRDEFIQIEDRTEALNHGHVYETFYKEFNSTGDRTNLYGMIFKAGNIGQENYGTRKLFYMYSLRGVIGRPNFDIFYRSIAASYLIRMASYEALYGSKTMAVEYLKQAAVYGAGSPGVYMNIALVYNLELKDPQSAVPYIEKVIAENPYDTKAMDIMVKTLMNLDADEALRWLKILYSRLPNEDAKKQTEAKIHALEAAIAEARQHTTGDTMKGTHK